MSLKLWPKYPGTILPHEILSTDLVVYENDKFTR